MTLKFGKGADMTFLQSAELVAATMTDMVRASQGKISGLHLSTHLASLAGHIANDALPDDGERAAFVLDLIEEVLEMSKTDAKSLLMLLKQMHGGDARAH